MIDLLHDDIAVTPGDAPPAGKLDMHPGRWRSSGLGEFVRICEMDDTHLVNSLRWIGRTFGRPVPKGNTYWYNKAKELANEINRLSGSKNRLTF